MKDFFSDLAVIAYKEVFLELLLVPAQDFIDDVDALIEAKRVEDERLRKYWAKRNVNADQARRIHKRLTAVLSVDAWDKTKHIPCDVFGDQHERIQAIIEIENKKLRIAWVLWAMYHWLMFDELFPGAKKYGKRYSRYRKLWHHYHDDLQERVRQERWDAKRERVRARREKRRIKKRYAKRTADETLAALKERIDVQRVITDLEPMADLPTGSEPIVALIGDSIRVHGDSRVLYSKHDTDGGLND